jgi:hypothetical protein
MQVICDYLLNFRHPFQNTLGNWFNHKMVLLFSFVIFTGCSTDLDPELTAPEKVAVQYFNAFLATDSGKLKQLSTKKHYQRKFEKTAKKEIFKPNLLTLLSFVKDGTYTKKLQYLDEHTATLDIEIFKKSQNGWQLTLIKNDNGWKVDDVKATIDPSYQALYVTIEKTGLSTDKSLVRPDDTAILVTNNTEQDVSCRLFKLLDGQNQKQIRLGFRSTAKDTEELIIPKGLDSSEYHLICKDEGTYNEYVNFSVR